MTHAAIPPEIEAWFASRGWRLRGHQLGVIAAEAEDRHALVMADTGAGKTLAGFLPTLAAFCPSSVQEKGAPEGLHTLYVSPLKALAHDVQRNLLSPIADMGLDVRVEARSGDTPGDRKARQRARPPHVLLTTPESLSLLLTYPEAPQLFAGLRRVVIDEIHAFATGKRGDLLALALARLQALSPGLLRVGLSATLADPQAYRGWLAPWGEIDRVALVQGDAGAPPEVDILVPEGARIPWSGHAATWSIPQLYEQIRAHRTTLVFTNTRFLAEYIFEALWDANEDTLPIAIHHGSLSKEARRKVEGAMARGELRALVCTASLDLGVDWGDIDLVVQMGAPKGSSRLLQRIGRANHRLDQPSRALLVPGNRFEFLEAFAAQEAVQAGQRDGEGFRPGGLDVLAQHVMGCICSGPQGEAQMLREVRSSLPYAWVDEQLFARVLDFVSTGGYALRAYDRFRRIVREHEKNDVREHEKNDSREHVRNDVREHEKNDVRGRGNDNARDGAQRRGAHGAEATQATHVQPEAIWRLAHPEHAVRHRLNAGIIVDAQMLDVRFRNGRSLGKVEENFGASLKPGDTFRFAGLDLEVESLRDLELVVRGAKRSATIPSYMGARMPISTHLADRVREMLSDRAGWGRFPEDVREWLEVQDWRSHLPAPGRLLVESFPHRDLAYTTYYTFEGWNANQSLGMLITRRMEDKGLGPLGFVATDYALSVWGLHSVTDPRELLSADILTHEFVDWVQQSHLLRRAFREVAVISGLVERQQPGARKSGRQVTFSTDLIFDVLQRHEPEHLLIEAAWADARARMTDVARVADVLDRAAREVDHVVLDRISPLSVPVLSMIGRETLPAGASEDALLAEAETLAGLAMRVDRDEGTGPDIVQA